MKVVAIIQARMGSTRLPGKVMMPLAGKPSVERVIERASWIPGVHEVVLATTTDRKDEPMAQFVSSLGIHVTRGSENDVLARYQQAAEESRADLIVRITADCPVLSPTVSGRVLAAALKYADAYDYYSNIEPTRTFPKGLDTDVFSRAMLARTNRAATSQKDREHVTDYMYETKSHKLFLLKNDHGRDHSSLRLTVDYPEDFELIRRLYDELYPINPRFDYEDILACLSRHPDWEAINRDAGKAK